MGHADIKITMRYLHHKSRADDARLLSAAFTPEPLETGRRDYRRRCLPGLIPTLRGRCTPRGRSDVASSP